MGSAGMAKLKRSRSCAGTVPLGRQADPGVGFADEPAQYYLAAHADQVYLHPSGAVLLTGLGGYRNYLPRCAGPAWGDGQRVSRREIQEFRGAVREQRAFARGAGGRILLAERRLDQLHRQVEQARKLPTGALGRMIDELPVRLGAAGGDLAKLALSEKLVDALMTRDELRALLIKRGAEDPAHKTFRQVSFQDTATGCPTAATAVRRWRWWSCRATSSMAMPRRARSVVVRRPS